MGGEILSGPAEDLLFGRLGPGCYDDEGCRRCFFAGFCCRDDACVGDRRMAEKDPFHITWVHDLPLGDEAIGDSADDPEVPVLVGARRIPGP